MTPLTRDLVWTSIVDSLRQLMDEQGHALGDVTEATLLGRDLAISSIDMIHLVVAIEDRLNEPLNFDELATDTDGQFRRDLSLGELLAFVLTKVAGRMTAAHSAE